MKLLIKLQFLFTRQIKNKKPLMLLTTRLSRMYPARTCLKIHSKDQRRGKGNGATEVAPPLKSKSFQLSQNYVKNQYWQCFSYKQCKPLYHCCQNKILYHSSPSLQHTYCLRQEDIGYNLPDPNLKR